MRTNTSYTAPEFLASSALSERLRKARSNGEKGSVRWESFGSNLKTDGKELPAPTRESKGSNEPSKATILQDIAFCGSYASLHCEAGSSAVQRMVQQQALAVADLALRNLLDIDNNCTNSTSDERTTGDRSECKRDDREESWNGMICTCLLHSSCSQCLRAIYAIMV
jgi:hypothetical protein